MDATKLRAWWWHRQGLDGRLIGHSEADVLAATGWARSVASATPYLSLFARCGALRESVDAATAHAEIHELPGPRGCTYIVPRQDFALALRVGEISADSEMSVARKLGVTDKEVDRLAGKVLGALAGGPLTPDELKTALGAAVRNLGEEGKKKGVTNTLPLALGRLQSVGEIRRIPVNGRLDQQRYRYALWSPNPLASFTLTLEEAYTELARRYFDWIGPATQAEFQWFSGLGVKAAKAALEPLSLQPAASGDDRLLPAALAPAFARFRAPTEPQYALVGSLDAHLLLRRNLPSLFDPEEMNTLIHGGKSPASGAAIADLPSHAILDRGRVVGLWEYDPEKESIAWMHVGKVSAGLRDAVARTEDYIRRHLGDARSFSLDSPKSRAPRLAALRGSRA